MSVFVYVMLIVICVSVYMCSLYGYIVRCVDCLYVCICVVWFVYCCYVQLPPVLLLQQLLLPPMPLPILLTEGRHSPPDWDRSRLGWNDHSTPTMAHIHICMCVCCVCVCVVVVCVVYVLLLDNLNTLLVIARRSVIMGDCVWLFINNNVNITRVYTINMYQLYRCSVCCCCVFVLVCLLRYKWRS